MKLVFLAIFFKPFGFVVLVMLQKEHKILQNFEIWRGIKISNN